MPCLKRGILLLLFILLYKQRIAIGLRLCHSLVQHLFTQHFTEYYTCTTNKDVNILPPAYFIQASQKIKILKIRHSSMLIAIRLKTWYYVLYSTYL